MVAVLVDSYTGEEEMVTHTDYQMSKRRDAERLAAMRRAGLVPAVNSDGSPVRGRWGQIVCDQSDLRRELGLRRR